MINQMFKKCTGRLYQLGLLGVLLVGCTVQSPQRRATSVPITTTPISTRLTSVPVATVSNDLTALGIQATLDQYGAIVRAKQNDRLASVLDPSSPNPLSRLLLGLTESYQDPVITDLSRVSFRIKGWKQRGPQLVAATVELTWDGRHYLWLFREVTGRWLFTGVMPDELGERHTETYGSINITYYAWDTALVQALLPQLSGGVKQVQDTLGVPSINPINVSLYPELTASSEHGKGEYQSGGLQDRNRISLITYGLAFGSYNPWQTFDQSVATVFRHEYTHQLNDTVPGLPSMDAMPIWMSEGLAEYVAGDDHLAVPAFRDIALNNKLPSVCTLESFDETRRGILYGTAQQITSYIVSVKGGLPMFWKLAEKYRNTPGSGAKRIGEALEATFGQSCDEFDSAWQAWSRQRATAWVAPN